MRSWARPPAVAGLFYPANCRMLSNMVESLLAAVPGNIASGPVPKAIIVPHAGYAYSGPVAASAYARAALAKGRIDKVVVLGPAHSIELQGMAASSAGAFATPLGALDVDVSLRDELVREGFVSVVDSAHRSEHSLEVQLPFIQLCLGEVLVLPICVGETPAGAVAGMLERIWDGPETLVVLSTDLSHYHDRETARRLDRRTAAAIVACDPAALRALDACGFYPLRGLLTVAAKRAMAVETLDLRSSADTAGGPERVVGYGAFCLS